MAHDSPTVVVLMFEIAKHQVHQRRLETIAVTTGFAGLALSLLAVASDTGVFGDTTASSAQPIGVTNAIMSETGPETIDAFLASGLYQFGWMLGLGVYFAYRAGSLLAEDVEHNRVDVLLSAPVSRSAIVRQRFLALLITMLVVNAAVCVIVYLGTIAVGAPIWPIDLIAVHTFSIPYLLVCASIGLLFSVGASTSSRASVASAVVVLALFLFTRQVDGTSNEWLSILTPAHYYDPTAILVTNAYPVTDGLVLLVVALVLSSVGRLWFRSMDLR